MFHRTIGCPGNPAFFQQIFCARSTRSYLLDADGSDCVEALHKKAVQSVQSAVGLIARPDPKKALELIDAKQGFQSDVEGFRAHLAQRLGTDEHRRVETYRLESNMLEYINRVYILARRITRTIIEIESSIGEKN